MPWGNEPWRRTMSTCKDGWAYRLSYSPPKGGVYPKPAELRISVSAEANHAMHTNLRENAVRTWRYAKAYLRDNCDVLWEEQYTLFGLDRTFGFNACGTVQDHDGYSDYTFALIPSRVESIALSINFLLAECEFQRSESSTQLLAVNTLCERKDSWGHMMSGSVHPRFRRWLAAQAGTEKREAHIHAVERALRSAYGSMNPVNAELMRDMCHAGITDSGRFILQCPGNACDVAIYPDQDHGLEYEDWTPFGCHNLDAAVQQLTLLCGLAELSSRAHKELTKAP